MAAFENWALNAFVAQLGAERVFAQVLLRRDGAGFILRHVEDAQVPESDLRLMTIEELRDWAQTTVDGAFRPLKSAPNLRRGWHARASDVAALGTALDRLYPGALADWFAARATEPPVTNYREFTARQTGMYRITTFPDDARAAQIARACCDRRFCLKRRLWSVPSLAMDAESDKSLIPCLEPCAVLLEFARKTVRLEQEGELPAFIAPETARRLEERLAQPPAVPREADFDSPDNPRRLALLVQLPRRE